MISQTYTAGGTIEKGRAVKLSSGNVIHCAANDDACIGISLNSATSGNAIAVCVAGPCDARVGAAVTKNGNLMSDANGRLVNATSGAGEIAICQALEVGAAASGSDYALAKVMVYARKTAA